MKALLLYPEFSPYSYYNIKDVAKLTGAKYMESPLGLITLAALFPSDWDMKLIDMNTSVLDDSCIEWADLVFIGGMLPQQMRFLELIDRVHSIGKKVVAGGPDPTSQPAVYQKADYLVHGEAENSLQPFLDDLNKGVQSGEYIPDSRPDMTRSPVPKFDLLNFNDYMMIGIQFCRGCPFNCEFCDIIELYGRKPRTKTPQQIVKELDTLYNLGYRGQIDLVDDNFIGHMEKAKEVLRAVKEWSKKTGYPFYYSTEASVNAADDDELLGLMRDVDFRYVVVGVESADEKVLKTMQKRQNVKRKIIDDINKIHRYGIVVIAGFIVGSDDETSESARRIIDVIDQGHICMSMIGMLYAFPNTQLMRRLKKENRLFESAANFKVLDIHDADQATSGINFVTKRPRAEIISDFIYILENVFRAKNYFNRCLKAAGSIRRNSKFKPPLKNILKYASAFIKIVLKLGFNRHTFYYFWRNLIVILFTRISSAETVINLMALYIHYRKYSKFVIRLMKEKLNRPDQLT